MSRIFVIEDEEAINKLICTSRTVAGYETVPAYDGNECSGARSLANRARSVSNITPA